VFASSPAREAGLRRGDKIIEVFGKRTASADSLRSLIKENSGKAVMLTIARPRDVQQNVAMKDRPIKPSLSGYDTLQIVPVISDTVSIGIIFGNDFGNYPLTPYSFGSALTMGTSEAFAAITTNMKGLKLIFTGKEKAQDALQGPIGIATIYGGKWSWYRFWLITGLLSMVLAFMNILPIPALDGGHVVFLLAEVVSGRKLPEKVLERAQLAGMIILLSLMVFVIGNDIWKHILR
jgi:regulator of sigma E protease